MLDNDSFRPVAHSTHLFHVSDAVGMTFDKATVLHWLWRLKNKNKSEIYPLLVKSNTKKYRVATVTEVVAHGTITIIILCTCKHQVINN